MRLRAALLLFAALSLSSCAGSAPREESAVGAASPREPAAESSRTDAAAQNQEPMEVSLALPDSENRKPLMESALPREQEWFPFDSIGSAVAIGDPEKALAVYETSLEGKTDGPEIRLLRARLLIAAWEVDEAREELDRLIAENPFHSVALYHRALVSGLEGNTAERKSFLERALAADDEYPDALAALGGILIDEGNIGDARRLFDKALLIDPANTSALMGTGAALMRGKKYREAADAYSRAISFQADYSFAYIDRAAARIALGDRGGALSDLTEAIRLDPSYYWSRIDRGKMYIQEGRKREAIDDFNAAVALDPGGFAAYAYRAPLLFEAGRDGESIADFLTLLELDPEYRFANSTLGILYYRASEWKKSRVHFLEAYAFEAEEHSFALLAAVASRKDGKSKEAADDLMRLLRLLPKDSWYIDAAKFLIDPSNDLQFLARIEREKNRTTRTRMLFYAAVAYIASGKTRSALAYLLEIDGDGAPAAAETLLGRWELAQLTAKEKD